MHSESRELPLVSVAIPVRDGAKYIRLCLDSVLKQTYQNFEIIVVDDGSKDDTAKIVSEYAASDKRVRLIRQDNRGAGMARLRAFEASSGSLIAMLDSDDIWFETNLEKQVERMVGADGSVGVVYSWSLDMDENGNATGGYHAANIEGDVFNSLLFRNFIANASSTLIRRNYLQVAAASCEESWNGKRVQLCEEWELYLHLAKRCRFLRVPEFLVLYRQRANSLSRFYQSMAEAHDAMLRNITKTYPDTASILCRASKANYYQHLAHQNCAHSNAQDALSWIYKSAQAQLGVVLVRPDFYSLLVACSVSRLPSLSFANDVLERPGGSCSDAIHIDSQQPGDFIRHSSKIGFFVKHFQERLMHIASRLWSENSLLGKVPPVAVRTIDLVSPVRDITDVGTYAKVRIFVLRDTRPVGCVDIVNNYGPISKSVLMDAVVSKFGTTLIETIQTTESALGASPESPANLSASIVVCTYDRPDDLRRCLNSLVTQDCSHLVEIIVVDNHPSSGLTPPVVAEFEGLKLVIEPRQGSSYARNAGIAASRGDIVAVTDDDVSVPHFWLERLLSGFIRPDIMAVTGNTLPSELDCPSQQIFEIYGNGGLGHGFDGWEANSSWFHSPANSFSARTWLLGGTANVAFRSEIFSNPNIGLMREELGAGTPSGGGEDLYLFYRIVKAGYAVKYQPDAFVWHKHRRSMNGLRKQLFGYSKAQIAYQLTTLWVDCDWRAVASLVPLTYWHFKRVFSAITRRSDYPLSLIALEIAGNLAGPFGLIRSRLRALNLGRSPRYIPVCRRAASESLHPEPEPSAPDAAVSAPTRPGAEITALAPSVSAPKASVLTAPAGVRH